MISWSSESACSGFSELPARQRTWRHASTHAGLFSELRIQFKNAPPGTRVTQEGDADADVDLSMGFPMRGSG